MRVLLLIVVVLLGDSTADWLKYHAWTTSRLLKLLSETNCQASNVIEENSRIAYEESVERLERIFSQTDKSICSRIVDNLEYVYGPQIKLLDDCRKSRQLPPIFEQLALGSKSVAKFICRNDAEHIIEIVNPCTTLILDNKEVAETFKKFLPILNAEYEDPADTGKECGIIREVRSVSKSILRKCSKIYRELIFGALDAFLSTCPQ